MKKLQICLLLLVFVILFTGCKADKNSGHLSLIEIYSSDGELINSVEDEDILYKFSRLDYMDISEEPDSRQTELKNLTEELPVLYTIICYKKPAAVFTDESPEKLMEITVYENSYIIKEQVEPSVVKAMPVPEEFLPFYNTVPEEDKSFLLSLAEI